MIPSANPHGLPASEPLTGRSVLVLRPSGQHGELVTSIAQWGGRAWHAPVIEIDMRPNPALDAAASQLVAGRFEAVCLTSVNAVLALRRSLDRLGAPSGSVLEDVLVAAVGAVTARFIREQLHRAVDLETATGTAVALGTAFPPGSGRVLLPRSPAASQVLPSALHAKGYRPIHVDAYRLLPVPRLPIEIAEAMNRRAIDSIVFTSPSTARHFVRVIACSDWATRNITIGPTTSRACTRLGIRVHAQAPTPDTAGLLTALVNAAETPATVPPFRGLARFGPACDIDPDRRPTLMEPQGAAHPAGTGGIGQESCGDEF